MCLCDYMQLTTLPQSQGERAHEHTDAGVEGPSGDLGRDVDSVICSVQPCFNNAPQMRRIRTVNISTSTAARTAANRANMERGNSGCRKKL